MGDVEKVAHSRLGNMMDDELNPARGIIHGLIIGLAFWAIVLLVIYNIAYAATFTWTPPATNADGSKLTNLAGFKIYCGPSSGRYTVIVNVPGATVTRWTDDGTLVPKGTTRYCAITAYNLYGTFVAESGYSNEVKKDTLAPASPW